METKDNTLEGKVNTLLSKQTRLEYKMDVIFENLLDIKKYLEREENNKKIIEAKIKRSDAEREIKDREMRSVYENEKYKQEEQKYNSWYAEWLVLY